ncbi:hypothetical protein B0H14DRAFT_2569400 [Mycena olivaceomarginata]|nr:hypothetical protein B0H14DRAFT_2569400 [Mycena olivaceomarginata]
MYDPITTSTGSTRPGAENGCYKTPGTNELVARILDDDCVSAAGSLVARCYVEPRNTFFAADLDKRMAPYYLIPVIRDLAHEGAAISVIKEYTRDFTFGSDIWTRSNSINGGRNFSIGRKKILHYAKTESYAAPTISTSQNTPGDTESSSELFSEMRIRRMLEVVTNHATHRPNTNSDPRSSGAQHTVTMLHSSETAACGLRRAGIWNELTFSSTGISHLRTSSRTSPQDLTEKPSFDTSKVSELKSPELEFNFGHHRVAIKVVGFRFLDAP